MRGPVFGVEPGTIAQLRRAHTQGSNAAADIGGVIELRPHPVRVVGMWRLVRARTRRGAPPSAVQPLVPIAIAEAGAAGTGPHGPHTHAGAAAKHVATAVCGTPAAMNAVMAHAASRVCGTPRRALKAAGVWRDSPALANQSALVSTGTVSATP